jgi:hypothetical protein
MVFGLPIFLIRARPYDDHDLRTFLTPPDGCPTPCFMGIRPGVTTQDEAITILESHQWVSEMQIERTMLLHEEPQPSRSHISWRWSTSRPNRLQLDREASLLIVGQQVDAMVMISDFRLGDVILTYGIADKASLERPGGRWLNGEQFYDGWYKHECLWVHALGRGPTLYHFPVTIILRYNTPEKYAASSDLARCGQ